MAGKEREHLLTERTRESPLEAVVTALRRRLKLDVVLLLTLSDGDLDVALEMAGDSPLMAAAVGPLLAKELRELADELEQHTETFARKHRD